MEISLDQSKIERIVRNHDAFCEWFELLGTESEISSCWLDENLQEQTS